MFYFFKLFFCSFVVFFRGKGVFVLCFVLVIFFCGGGGGKLRVLSKISYNNHNSSCRLQCPSTS